MIQAFRADRLIAMASIFVATVLGETFVHSAEQELNLAEIITNEVGPGNIYIAGCGWYNTGIWYPIVILFMIAMPVHVSTCMYVVHVYRM